jgi:hypothetical protein
MSEPVRIQRKRVKGWSTPPNTVYVGRPTMWGNRWQIGTHSNWLGRTVATKQEAVNCYAALMWPEPHHEAWVRENLSGKNLMCWCRLDEPCHADVLLKIANGRSPSAIEQRGE